MRKRAPITRRHATAHGLCCWSGATIPAGDVLDEPVCGAPTLDGEAWCPSCRARAWQRVTVQAEQATRAYDIERMRRLARMAAR